MIQRHLAVGLLAAVVIAACQHPTPSTTSSPAPTTRPTTTSQPATTTAQTPANQPGAPVTPRPRPPRLSADSLSKLRRVTVNQVMAAIAGHENEPAGQVFKNISYNKEMPAGEFVNMMDSQYGRALGWRCENCHVTTDLSTFSSDAKKDKGRAKIMQQMTNEINATWMPKLSPEHPEKATCMMCHRGTNAPKDTVETYRTITRPPGGGR